MRHTILLRGLTALVAGGVLAHAPEALALPPQAVAAGVAALAWMAALGASVLALALAVLPRRIRIVASVLLAIAGLCLAAWWASATWTVEAPDLEPGQPGHAVTGAQAATWLGDPSTLWVDLRGADDFLAGHVRGAQHVGLVVGQPFDPRAIDALARPGALSGLPAWPADHPRDWSALARQHHGGGLLAVPALARVDALFRAAGPPAPARVVVYCHSGRTSTPLVVALRARGVPAFVVAGGVNELPPSELVPARPDEAALPGDAVERPVPSEATIAGWARFVDAPPPELPAPRLDRVLRLLWHDTGTRLRGEWLADVARGWGYGAVRLDAAPPPLSDVDLEADAQTPAVSQAGTAGARLAWSALLGLLLFTPLVTTWLEVRRRLRGQPTGPIVGVAGGLQLGLLVVLEALYPAAWGVAAWDRLLDAPVWTREGARVAIALGVLWHLARPRRQRVTRLVAGWRERVSQRAGPEPEAPAPAGLTQLALALSVGLLVGWAKPATAAVGLVLLVAEPVTLVLVDACGRWRLSMAGDVDARARWLLTWAGRAPRGSSTATVTVQSRDARGPAWVGVTPAEGAGHESHSVFGSTRPEVLDTWHAAAVVGHDLAVGFDAAGRCVELRVLGTPSPSAAVDLVRRQLQTICWMGLLRGVAPKEWREIRLRADRYVDAAPGATTLTLDVLRRRAGPAGAEARALRRFGARPQPGWIVRLGAGIYDVASREPAPAGPAGKPGWMMRLAVHATVAQAPDAAARHARQVARRISGLQGPAVRRKPIGRGLRQLPRGASEWAARAALAADVARRVVTDLAAAEGVAAAPPIGPDEVRRTWPTGLDVEDGYELTGTAECVVPEAPRLHSPQVLEHGAGSEGLRRWRGTRRSAEEARDIARAWALAEVAALRQALRRWAAEEGLVDLLGDLTVREVLTLLLGRRGRASVLAQAELRSADRLALADWVLPMRLDGAALEQLGPDAPTVGARVAAEAGQPVGGRLPFEGVVGDTVVVVERAVPEVLMACAERGAALVARRGSSLSHAAVVARELGVPAILGAGAAIDGLREGACVRLEADGGLTFVGSATRNEL